MSPKLRESRHDRRMIDSSYDSFTYESNYNWVETNQPVKIYNINGKGKNRQPFSLYMFFCS